jgi:hypothetical protein
MAAPNLKSPTTVTGKTVGYAVTTSLAAALSNAAASGKALKVVSVYCANVDGAAAADIDLTHYNGTTDYSLAKTIAVPADATQMLVTREAPIYTLPMCRYCCTWMEPMAVRRSLTTATMLCR